jgi:predicted MFS family arabinose efflux permease
MTHELRDARPHEAGRAPGVTDRGERPEASGEAEAPPPGWLWPLLGLCCAVIAANLYYAQPLVPLLAPEIGLPRPLAGLCVTLTQIGYGLGLLGLVPLADIVQPRRLVVIVLLTAAMALLLVAMARSWSTFLPAALLLGITCTAAQMLVPFAGRLAPPAIRGRVIGTVVSGLLIGICLARPAASLGAQWLGWRGMFLVSMVLMLAVAGLLWAVLPAQIPLEHQPYGRVLRSLVTLWRRHRTLRFRSFCHAGIFAGFSLFWTVTPIYLTQVLGASQTGIALFALAGASGAVAAPIFGRIADRGWSRPATFLAAALVGAAFLICWFGRRDMLLLALAGIVLDFGVQANLVLSQRAIYGLDPGAVSRLNGVFMAVFFFSGAAGSALASPIFETWRWTGVCVLGMCFAGLALLTCLGDGLRTDAPRKEPDHA